MDATKIKIVIIEDQEDDAELIKRELRQGKVLCDIRRVDDKPGFEAQLRDFQPDAILSDHSLPQFNSIEALRIRAEIAPDIPFILVTGAVSEEFAAQCIKLGADDYILKSNLSRLTTALENAIEYRTLERQRLKDEQKIKDQYQRLSRAHGEIDSFVYSVSHNLRSPLSSVMGLVNVARHEASQGPVDTLKYLNLIDKSVRRLDETIREILDYARNERLEPDYTAIDIKELIDETLEKLQFMQGYSAIQKEIRVTSSERFISDRFRIGMILNNLFSNAIKYANSDAPERKLLINVVVTPKEATLTVADNGVGISPDVLPKIFDMFYRGTELSDGAGLGLYIVRGTIERLGGTLRVKSQPGGLTTFTITLPNHQPRDNS